MLALTGLGDPNGIVISLALLVANAFVVYALVTGGSWFATRPT